MDSHDAVQFVALQGGRRIAYREQGMCRATAKESLLVLHGLGCSRVAGMPGEFANIPANISSKTNVKRAADRWMCFFSCFLVFLFFVGRCFGGFVEGDGGADRFNRQAGVWAERLQSCSDMGDVLSRLGAGGGHSGAGTEDLVAGILMWRGVLLGSSALYSGAHCGYCNVGSCWELPLEGTVVTYIGVILAL